MDYILQLAQMGGSSDDTSQSGQGAEGGTAANQTSTDTPMSQTDYLRQFALQQLAASQNQPDFYVDYPSSGARVPQTQMTDSPQFEPSPNPRLPATPTQVPSYPGSELYQQWLKTRAGPAPEMPFVASSKAIQEGQANVPLDVQAILQGMTYGQQRQ